MYSKTILEISKYDSTEESAPSKFETNYTYKIQNNIVYITIKVVLTPWYASGDGNFIYNYTYDIKNDKELNLTEAFESLGMLKSEISEKMCNMLKDTYDDITKVNCTDSPKPDNSIGSYYIIDENNEIKINYYNLS